MFTFWPNVLISMFPWISKSVFIFHVACNCFVYLSELSMYHVAIHIWLHQIKDERTAPTCKTVLITVASYQMTNTLHVTCFQHSLPSSCISSSVLCKLLLFFLMICTSSQLNTVTLNLHKETAFAQHHWSLVLKQPHSKLLA